MTLLKKPAPRAALVFALCLLILPALQSCTMVPTATNFMVENKMNSAVMGASTAQSLSEFGFPHYRTVVLRGGSRIEIWGYDMGNYWVNEAVVLFFKNDSLVGITKHPYEMLRIMSSLGILGDESFFGQILGGPQGITLAAADAPETGEGEHPLLSKMRAAASGEGAAGAG